AALAAAALNETAAAVARGAARDVLLGAGRRDAGARVGSAALTGDAAAAAGRAGRAGAALDAVSAAVPGRPARDPLRGARGGRTRRGIRVSALSRYSAAPAGLRRHAGAAVDLVAASVAGGAARNVLLLAGLGLARAGLGEAALPEHAATAARLRRRAASAIERCAAPIAGGAAADALGLAGSRGAAPGIGEAALTGDAAAAARLGRGAAPAIELSAAAVACGAAAQVLLGARQRDAGGRRDARREVEEHELE